MGRKKNCEDCGAPHDRTANGAMPYGWGPGPVRWLCGQCRGPAYARFEAAEKVKAELPSLAFELLVDEGEWVTEMAGGDWHYMTCLTCGASHANRVKSDPDLKHVEGCRRKLFFDTARMVK